MGSIAITPDFLRDPIGADCPVEAYHKSSLCTLTVAGLNFDGSCEVIAETQQPRVTFHLLAKRHGQIIFTAEHCSMTLEALSNNAAEKSKVAIRIDLVPSKEPIMPSSNRDGPLNPEKGAKWVQLNSLEWTGQKVVICVSIGKNHPSNIGNIVSWMQNLVNFVRYNVRNEGPRKSHWFARMNEVIPGTNRRPLMPWLFPKSQSAKNMQYGRLSIRDAFFVDDNDRRGFLLEATRNERAAQLHAITKVFNLENFHKAYFQYKKANNSWNVHVNVMANPAPVIAEFMDVKFALRPQDDHVLTERELNMRVS